MPDRGWSGVLAALLPRATAREVFEPAWCDLRITYLDQLNDAPSRARRRALRVWLVLRVIVLFLDCWRLALLHPGHWLEAPPYSSRTESKERAGMFFYHLRHGFLRLLREPAFAVAAVLTLALGVGTNVAVFAAVEAVLLRPLPYADANQLVIVNHRDVRTGITKEFIAIGDFVDLTQRQTVFESLASYGDFEATVYGADEPYQVAVLAAGPGLLETLRVRPLLGRGLAADDAREGAAPVVMLGYELWQKRFGGDPAAVGRSIRIQRTTRTIVGIAPRGFRFPPNADNDLIVPATIPLQAPAERKSGWTFGLARLKPNETVERATVNLGSISRQMEAEHPEANQGSTYYAVPLRDALVGPTKTALVLLLAAVGVLLLIACANVANLQLARSLARRREMAVRMALGAGRSRLAALLLSESFALALVASALGIAFSFWGVRALIALVPESVSAPGLTDVRINGLVLGFALCLTIVTALAFGSVAALTLRLEQGAEVLVSAGRATMTARVRRATSTLVAVEIAFAVVLLVGAGLILRSFAGLLSVDPGFRYEQVMTVDLQLPADRYAEADARAAFYSRAFEGLRAVPEVREVGAAVVMPLTGNNWTVPFERADQPVPAGERPPDVGWQAASGGFFKALQIPLRSGRVFDERDRAPAKPVVIISEAVEQKFFPNESAVGREIKLGDQKAEIVGVVGNIRRAGLNDKPRADMYFPFERNPGNQITLFLHTSSDPLRTFGSIQSTLRAIEPNLVLTDAATLAQVASESVRLTRLMLWLLGAFAAAALLLAAVGIYGVMSYVVRQRTREIGTRMAVGANRGAILLMVLRYGAVVAVTGIGAGLLIALAAARVLRSILFGVSASDPLTLTVATVVLAGTTLIACYLPARRASAIDPARTLAQQ